SALATALASAGLTPVRSATSESVAPPSNISIAFSIVSVVNIGVLLLRELEVSQFIANCTSGVFIPETFFAPAISALPNVRNPIAYRSPASGALRETKRFVPVINRHRQGITSKRVLCGKDKFVDDHSSSQCVAE